MRNSAIIGAVIAAAVLSAAVAGLLRSRDPATKRGDGRATASSAGQSPSPGAAPLQNLENPDAKLAEKLKTLCAGANGDIGVAVIHVETGRTALIDGATQLPLYSVFKLPVAITVLQDASEKRLALDKKVRVTPDDVAPGSQFNTDLWRQPVEKTVTELLELSLVRSDNTSSDKLLQLVGGPAAVTERMHSLGFPGIDIQYTTREFAARRDKPNTGAASDLARLLAKLQKGELLQPAHQTLLLEFMTRSMTGGERRLRADLPPGTPVADKTGSGGPGASTNDVGLITLPEGKGHLAIAVLVSRSKLSVAAQEKLIAQLARAAYDFFVSASAPYSQ